jgi:two-component system response regulator TctD
MQVLLVADKRDVGEDTVARLGKIGCTVVRAVSAGFDSILSSATFDLLILDLAACDFDGLGLLRELRDRGRSAPVLVLAALSAIRERIAALELGADDYLIKPIDYRELEARVRALFQKTNSVNSTKQVCCGNLFVDRRSRSLLVNGTTIELTRREFALVETFARHPGRVFSKDEIIEQLFGLEDEPPTENAVEQIVARIRRKLLISESDAEIRTLRRLGYKLVKRPDQCCPG